MAATAKKRMSVGAPRQEESNAANDSAIGRRERWRGVFEGSAALEARRRGNFCQLVQSDGRKSPLNRQSQVTASSGELRP
ncbi:unnamed protein product [Linum trigynum]|uniref:Uncharacterized protein n=1 Tax=Linum trigynum TaxID=586398 RepID=A0AAV2GR72_9ROSI